ncbi:DUF5654 family protein [Ammoniphilus sp. CFH 90114]|uniref:DUF5654 family protein n=1 Tax=Ammoniphilus sp. CFH 90114 TaxID=2493665 RepID=UPI00100E4219|nr:DUF5654 family protein [Ammoniphilus sp. CFH 90114]RXT13741.1 hypothetical protein EIZ39_06235 [Ammoniphilus sp. CFH 90114]
MSKKIMEQIITLFTAGFGVIAALAWNEAVQSLFDRWFLFPSDTVKAKFFYAITVTIIAVLITSLFAGLRQKQDDE